MDELKSVVRKLVQESNNADAIAKKEQEEIKTPHRPAAYISYKPEEVKKEDFAEAQEVENRPLAVDEMEKELIRKALIKHQGKRKYAAMDLKISERTLYRKIKEYGLDDL